MSEKWALLKWVTSYISNNQEKWEIEKEEKEKAAKKELDEWKKMKKLEKIEHLKKSGKFQHQVLLRKLLRKTQLKN